VSPEPDPFQRVDADIHVPAPPITALHPYLSEYWRDYLRENGFSRPPAVSTSYPPRSAIMARATEELTVEDLQRDVLAGASHAVLNCYYAIESVRHPFLAGALATAVNSWVADEFLSKDDRLFSGIVVPPQDTELAVQEIERVGSDPRFSHVFLTARSWEPYGIRRLWPIYAAAAERDLAIVIHFGGFAGTPATPVGNLDTYFEQYSAATQLFATHIQSFVAEGVFERYPTLRVGLLESGVTWLPSWMWKLETEWKAMRREVPWVRHSPWAYVREHFRMTAQPLDIPVDSEDELAQVIAHIGSDDMLMFASDYPHLHQSDPETLLPLLSPVHREKFLRSNAWSFYALEDRVTARRA
jgi:predicted TIM-barrel fold metal-dependent hydrolase